MVMFVGSPLYVVYLRALGARIGRGVTIFSTHRAGVHRPAHHRRGTVIRNDASFTGYRAEAG